MLIETIVLGITFAQAWKVYDTDEQALNKLKKARDKHADAIDLFEGHKQAADASLQKLVNRKGDFVCRNESLHFCLRANQKN